MGYLFLGIALLCGATKGYCGKKTSGFVSEYKDALFSNSIRMLICIVIGFILLCIQGNVMQLRVDMPFLLVSIFSGVATSIFVVSWLLVVRKGAYMMLDIFLTIGVIFPIVLSKIFFNEEIRINQWIGLGILLIAVIIMCSYNNQIKEKLTLSSVALLVLSGTANGLCDFSQKTFTKVVGGNVAVFNFYTYVFSAIVLIVLYMIEKHKNPAGGTEKEMVKKVGIYVTVMAICLFAYSYFKTIAASYLSAVLLYPLSCGCGLIVSSLMSAVFFKERLTPRCIIGIIIAFAGLFVINVL